MKRCIFCKRDSNSSKSIEHIVPESLGNTTFVLPPGVVCDKCNNYFAIKIEKDILCSKNVQDFRSYNFIQSKKGKIPIGTGLIDGTNVRVRPTKHGKMKANIDVPSSIFNEFFDRKSTQVMISIGNLEFESKKTSRFIAKMALEALAFRVIENGFSLDVLVDDVQFDPLRQHARIGSPENWNISKRVIYNSKLTSNTGESYSIVYHYDLLRTEFEEIYFIISLWGVEYAINCGGPSMDGFKEWLQLNKYKSPLHIDEMKLPFF